MPKTIYANDVMHINGQRKGENIYMAFIHMYARFILGVYGLYTYICNDLEAWSQSAANQYIYIYIYIYICLNLGVKG